MQDRWTSGPLYKKHQADTMCKYSPCHATERPGISCDRPDKRRLKDSQVVSHLCATAHPGKYSSPSCILHNSATSFDGFVPLIRASHV